MESIQEQIKRDIQRSKEKKVLIKVLVGTREFKVPLEKVYQARYR